MTMDATESRVRHMRAGFLGAGFMTRVHSRAVRTIGAVADSVATRTYEGAVRAVGEYGIQRAVDGVDALLSNDAIDVVHVCTPNVTHADLALRVLEAGKHVICEKPLATNLADAAALAGEAERRGVLAAVPFVYRYHPMVREARARVAAGQLGSLLTIEGRYLQDWMLLSTDDDWRATARAGGPSRAFADIGSHLIDLFEFVAGERVMRLSARTRRVFDTRGGRAVTNEDAVAIVLETTSGAIGTLLVSQMAPGRKNSLTLELHGDESSIRFDQERPEELWIGSRSGGQLLLRDPNTASPGVERFSRVPAGHAMGYQDAFTSFIADAYSAIDGAVPDGLPTFRDGLRSAQLTEAVLVSARSEKWIDVSAVPVPSSKIGSHS